MKNSRLKIIASIIIFMMIFQYISFIIPFIEAIAVEATANGVTWNYETDEEDNNGGIKIKVNGNSIVTIEDNTLEIPNEIDGKIVTKINNNAFEGWNSNNTQGLINSIVIPTSVKRIGDYAFEKFRNITSFTIGKNVEKIGNGIFAECTNLETITVENENTNFEIVDGVLFNKDKTRLITYPANKDGDSYTIPNTVTEIAPNAFQGCAKLKTITLNSNISKIPAHAFEGCSSLTTINNLNNVSQIEMNAFKGCESLQTISIPTSVTEIKEGTFENCTSLESVNFHENVTNIEKNAFKGCTSLQTISIPAAVGSIGEDAFLDCTNLEAINVNEANIKYESVDGVLFKKIPLTLIKYPEGKTVEGNKYEVNTNVKEIAQNAFKRCKVETKIIFGVDYLTVNDNAFTNFIVVCKENSNLANQLSSINPILIKKVEFDDVNLYNYFKENKGDYVYDYDDSDKWLDIEDSIEEIDISSKGITSLTGLERLTKLKKVTADNNSILYIPEDFNIDTSKLSLKNQTIQIKTQKRSLKIPEKLNDYIEKVKEIARNKCYDRGFVL